GLQGAATSSPLGGALFVLFSLSLLGLPPLPGFWSKFLVLGGLAEAGSTSHLLAIAVILIGTVLEGSYLMRVITTLYGKSEGEAAPPRQRFSNLFASSLAAVTLIAAVVLIEPLWQGLNALSDSATDTRLYTQTVLGMTAGGR
ncbi:MAG: proton-conducting transporter membrane subunit, partial [Sedimenticolaceae bacterium]